MEMQQVSEFSPAPLNPKIAELGMKAAVAEKTAVNLMDPGQKKKRGRPPGTAKKNDQTGGTTTSTSAGVVGASESGGTNAAHISSARIAEPLVKMISKAGGAYVGDKRAEMTASELNDVAESLGLVMDKWMPVISKDFGAEFLLVSAFTAYGIRIAAMKKVLDEDRKRVQDFAKPIDPDKPMASQLAIHPELQPQGHDYRSPTIGL